MNENELIIKAKSGDLEAYEKIIKLYEKKVFNIIYYMVKDENQIEDIAQEVFIKIYKNLHNFKGNSSIYTWIYRITINTCIDTLKKHKKVIYLEDTIKNKDGEETKLQLEDNSKLPNEIVEDNEIKEKLIKCIRKLPYEQSTIIILRDIKGFSYMEIAEILKLNLGTVKSKISRARSALKEELEKERNIFKLQ